MKKTILIVGLGLIGGSVAVSLRKSPNLHVIGYDINEKNTDVALELNIIQEGTLDPKNTSERADIILFATPVNATLNWLDLIKDWPLKKDVIITDTGSTKTLIMEKACELRKLGITFIGGHPMAGSHKSGISAAKPYLFENAYYLLTPLESEEEATIQRLKEILSYTKAKLLTVSAASHDQMTAVVSHFPHIVAVSLVNQLKEESTQNQTTKMLAAGGFRDLTRIASSNPKLWRDITMQNRIQILAQLTSWQKEMAKVKEVLETGNADEIEMFFSDAKEYRDQLPSTKGALFSTYDLSIDVPDYPGSIAEITAYFAEEQISITNIRIIETREDVYGILVVSFQNEEDREKAASCIKSRTQYDVYIR